MKQKQKKILKINTITSLALQITIILCAFIKPRLFLGYFGSEINGLINSICQFLGIISFLELGVGAVVKSSLYDPLAKNDIGKLNEIITSANKFFKKIAYILVVYAIILAIVYPLVLKSKFNYVYISTLVLVISISLFSEYYFGIVNQLLLVADQKKYIPNILQIVAKLLNTFMAIILIWNKCSVHIMMFTTSLIYFLKPMLMYKYVKKNYKIDSNAIYINEPIKQKWNGISQHIAAVVLNSTDTIVLTMFSSLSNVSIYSIYYLIVGNVGILVDSLIGGVDSLIGDLLARKDMQELNKVYSWMEWSVHTLTTLCFGCTAVLIIPFVKLYTMGINDTNYIHPAFSNLLTLAGAIKCYRLPYIIMILAGGHYKQTQGNYIKVAMINIVISILSVKHFGLIGVAIGTIIALGYQTIWMAQYDSREFIKWPMKKCIKQFVVDFLNIILMFIISINFKTTANTYIEWISLAIKMLFTFSISTYILNFIFYRDKIYEINKRFIYKIKK